MRRSKRWAGFRSILCAIDFSEQSRLAMRYADMVARRGRAKLTVMYANDPLLVAAAAAALHDRGLEKRSARELEAFVRETLAPDATKSIRVETHISVGGPDVEILKTARRLRSDLIVVGTQGLTAADRLLMGSTTLRILRRTKVPVLAVPDSSRRNLQNTIASWPGERIIAAVELDRRSKGDAEAAGTIAEWFGSSLMLVHVMTRIAAPAWLSGEVRERDEIRRAEAESRLKAVAANLRGRAPVDARVVFGRIADELAALTATERSGLIVTALRESRVWLGVKRGSVSYDVVAQAAAPVLACPGNWRPL